MKEHGLRDLARVVMEAARKHPYYGQGDDVLKNAEDHLCALAAYFEGLGRERELEAKLNKTRKGVL